MTMLNKKQVTAMAAVLALSGVFAGQSVAAVDQAELEAQRARLLNEINQVESKPNELAKAISAGEDRSLLCSNCHGKDGNSVQPETPNLASQNPAFLLQQIEHFATGTRKNFVMNSLAANFTREDKVNLAIYFSNQKLKPQQVNAELAGRGKRIFESVCYLCHGADGKGGDAKGFARIAGQKLDYVVRTLKRFRAVARHEVANDEIVRDNPRMEQVTQNLTDADIEALANYVASLR